MEMYAQCVLLQRKMLAVESNKNDQVIRNFALTVLVINLPVRMLYKTDRALAESRSGRHLVP